MYGSRAEHIIPSSGKLRKESPLMGFVYRVLNRELIKIGSAIESAHKSGKDNTTLKLTFNFNCPQYIENKDVQRNVYYKIIEDLEKKNYEVFLEMKPKEVFLHIGWKVNIDNKKIEKMNDKLKSVMISK